VPALERGFRRAGARLEVARTRGRGDGADLAYAAARDGWPAVVAVGGDGIVHEVANGLMRAGSEGRGAALGVIAAGSGNDFAKMLGPPRDAESAAAGIATAAPRAVDIGRVSRWVVDSGGAAPWYFTNGIGLGFDAQVALEASRIRRLRGLAIYAAAAVRVLRDLRAPRMRVLVDGREVADRRLVLTTLGNGPCHGGAFWLCPDARIDDGLLDVLLADARGALELTALIPRVMRGRHLSARGVEVHRGRTVTLTSGDPLPIHADGEIVGEGVREIEVEVVPGGLRVLA
jgi:diacylglycerol kinase (ATP)